jgi:hypothetical protein
MSEYESQKVLEEVLPQRSNALAIDRELLTRGGAVIGSRAEIQAYIMALASDKAASVGIDSTQFAIGAISDVPKKLKRFAEFGFRITDSSVLETGKTDSYNIVDVYLAHSKDDRPNLVPLVLAYEMPSGLGVIIRDQVQADIQSRTGIYNPLSLVSKTTQAAIGDNIKSGIANVLKVTGAVLAIGAVGFGLVRGVSAIDESLVRNEKARIEKLISGIPTLEQQSARIMELPTLEQQHGQVLALLGSGKDGRSFSTSEEIIWAGLESKDPTVQKKAITIADRLLTIDFTSKRGFFFGGADRHSFEISAKVWSTAIDAENLDVRIHAMKTGVNLLAAARKNHYDLENCKNVIETASVKAPDQQVREEAARIIKDYYSE